MPSKTKLQIVLTLMLAALMTFWSSQFHSRNWPQFFLFLGAVLVSSGYKVALPRGDGSMSLNFPFILLGIVQLSPVQVLMLTAISVAAQCRFKVIKIFTAVQIVFNVANAMISAAAAYIAFFELTSLGMAMAPALALASLAYYFWNTISVAGVIASSKDESAITVWRAEFPWYLPFYIVGAVLAALANWISGRYGWTTALLLVPMVYTVYRAYTGQIARIRERQQHLEDTEALHLRTIEGLAMAIEAKDQGTHDHLFRVRSYVQEVAKAMNLSKLEMQALHTAAFLHDIGKLAVPEHIINKPGKLTPEEFEKMKIHPGVGADILERVRFPYPVVPIVRSHHEWWDGSGYPDGLKGEEIPIGARILTVVDCFDALVSDRPYRKGMPVEKALGIVKEMSGRQFDPRIVELFEKLYHSLQTEVEKQPIPVFVPLVAEVVSRGHAPGAGFEKESELPGQIRSALEEESAASTASLNLITAAGQEAQALFEINQSLGNSLNVTETISVMVSRLRQLVTFDSCALYLKHGDELIARFVDGESAADFAGRTIAMGEGISGWVCQSGKAILNGNAAVEPLCVETTELRSALSIPLFDAKKDVFGVLTLYSPSPDAFRRDHLRILQAMESKLALSVQNALNFRRAENDAETDFLTGLPNARSVALKLKAELAERSGAGERLGIVVCDLNSFKNVNDEGGHLAGNKLLAAIAETFQQICGPTETVGRVGGDEFVFLIPGMEENNAGERLECIAAAVNTASRRAEVGKVTASLGAAFYPVDGHNAEELLALADRRMYLDKEAHYKAAMPGGQRFMEAFAACE